MKQPFPNKRFYCWYFGTLFALAMLMPFHFWLGFFSFIIVCLAWFPRITFLTFAILLAGLFAFLFLGYVALLFGYFPGTLWHELTGRLILF